MANVLRGAPIETEEFTRLKEEAAANYLEHVRQKVSALDAAAVRLEAVKASLAPSGVSYDGLPKGRGEHSDPVPALAVRLELCEDQYRAQEQETRETLSEAAQVLAEMPDQTRATLIELRFVYGYTWEHVGRVLQYSEAWCRWNHHEALCELYSTMPHQWRVPAQPAI